METEARRDALVERLFGAAIGALDLYTVYLGDRLGLYAALREHGALTSTGLGEAAGVDERYAREWLEQQAATGILEVEDAAARPLERRFSLPAGHDEVLLDETSLSFLGVLGRELVAVVRPIDQVVAAFRSGDGVPYPEYGDLHESIEMLNRPLFDNLLGSAWLPAVPDVHARLLADPPARVADLGCGCGRSTIAIGRAYPNAVVDGIDNDEASIARARTTLAESSVDGRVSFVHRDAADPELAGRYDLVTIFEALHDMSYPVAVLNAARGLLADGGCVIVGDERTGEAFTAPADELERLYYGFSVMHCLPVGMVGEGAAGTGTVIRPDTVRRYGLEAGFSSVEVLPIEHDFWRFYRLSP